VFQKLQLDGNILVGSFFKVTLSFELR